MEKDEKTADLEQQDTQNQNENNQDENQDDSQNQDDSNSNEDEKDWKAEALKQKAINERLNKRLNKPESRSESKKSDDFDYAKKAFLTANGIKGDEVSFIKDELKKFGGELDELVENEYFQAKLKDFREKKATRNATPSSSKRTNNSSRDEVDYWIAKGELPPATEVELRRKVVNERIKRETKTNVFL